MDELYFRGLTVLSGVLTEIVGLPLGPLKA